VRQPVDAIFIGTTESSAQTFLRGEEALPLVKEPGVAPVSSLEVIEPSRFEPSLTMMEM